MKLNKRLIIILLFLTVSISFAKKAITFEDIMKFQNLTSPTLTDNGSWLTYRLDKQRGNNIYVLQSLESDKKIEIEKGSNTQYSQDTKWFAVKTDVDVIKQLNPEK